jgi:alkylhydroperoxidase/carboxymuconolactone decarboxylase family protein YurZ
MPSSTDFKALTREISGNVSQLRTSQPEVMQSFNAMGKAALAPGAIDAKTKELIAWARRAPRCTRPWPSPSTWAAGRR